MVRGFLRFRKFWWVYGLVSTLLLAQILRNSVPGDSIVFFQAGIDVREGINPWLKAEDSVNFQYLNGPFFSIACSLFSFLGSRGMYFCMCFISISLIPWCVSLVGRLFSIEFDSKYLARVSTLLLLSYPVRANLQYGQFVIPYVCILVLILLHCLKSELGKMTEFLMGLGFISLLDFKPHLFFVWMFILLLPNRNFLRAGFLMGMLVEFFSLKLITGTFVPTEWFSRLLDRGQGSAGLAGFYNLNTLTSSMALPSVLKYFLIAFLVLLLSVVSFRHMKSKTATFVVLYLTLFPAMHPQDFFLVLLLAISLIANKPWTKQIYFSLGLWLVWSSNALALSIQSLIIIVLYFALFGHSKFGNSVPELALLLLPSLLIRACDFLGVSMDSYRTFANLLAIMCTLLIFGTHSRSGGFPLLIRNLYSTQSDIRRD